MIKVPSKRPQLTGTELEGWLKVAMPLLGFNAPLDTLKKTYKVFVVGIRGYYKDTIGKVDQNDRNEYDDAIYVFANGRWTSFNGNTDPSKVRAGEGTGAAKGMAVLNPGVWLAHKLGLHKGEYLALVQRMGVLTVTRDGRRAAYTDTGNFGINIHRGGVNTTSSLGCQTIPPAQYKEFIDLVSSAAKKEYGTKWNDTVIPYILIENPE